MPTDNRKGAELASHEQRRINGTCPPQAAVPVARAAWRVPLVLVWVLLIASIVVLSFLPDTNAVVAFVRPVWSDPAHVSVYALLTLLTLLLLEMPVSLRMLLLVVVGISLFGGSIEVFQQMAGRTTSLLDAGWNVLGTMVGASGYLVWIRRRNHARNTTGRCWMPEGR